MNQKSANTILTAGCMTGTSIDGIDVALVRKTGQGLSSKVEFIRGESASLGELSLIMRRFADGEPFPASEITRMAYDLGAIHRDILRKLLRNDKADLIVLHGQTVFHKPPLSWQMINPWPVALEFGAKVIFDLRGADLAAGGQGAPITPLADFLFYRDEAEARLIINLGGFINYTYIPAGIDFPGDSSHRLEQWAQGVRGGDVSACNQQLDRIARLLVGKPFDEGGKGALAGSVIHSAMLELKDWLRGTMKGGRSLGSGDEAFEWVERYRNKIKPNDMLRTACAAIAGNLGETLAPYGDCKVVMAGGGTKNRGLMQEIALSLGRSTVLADRFGLPSDFRESAGIAALGAMAQEGLDLTISGITGRDRSFPVWCSLQSGAQYHS